jgi:hypothetical protein
MLFACLSGSQACLTRFGVLLIAVCQDHNVAKFNVTKLSCLNDNVKFGLTRNIL